MPSFRAVVLFSAPWVCAVAPSAAAAQAPAASPAGPRAPARLLTDFGGQSESAAAGRWYTVLDGVMGGRSTGAFVVEHARLVFTGTLNTNGGGFASVRRRAAGFDLGQPGEEGMRLRVRGDGRTYTLRLRQPTERRGFDVSYRGTFDTRADGGWQEVWLPYARLVPTWRGRVLDRPPVDPGRVDEVGLSIDDGVDGPYRLEVDALHTYGPFAFDDYAWRRRPLVVLAPTLDDPRVQRQREAVARSRDGFDERDVVLVLAAADGAGFAGARPLAPEAVAAVRARFGAALDGDFGRDLGRDDGRDDGAFAVLLVGKDGGVKRTARSPVPLDDVFAQIDGMPMRQRERVGRGGGGAGR